MNSAASLLSRMIAEHRDYRTFDPQPELTFMSRREKREEYVEIVKSKYTYIHVMARLRDMPKSTTPMSLPKTPRTCGMLSKRTFETEAKVWRDCLKMWHDHFMMADDVGAQGTSTQ